MYELISFWLRTTFSIIYNWYKKIAEHRLFSKKSFPIFVMNLNSFLRIIGGGDIILLENLKLIYYHSSLNLLFPLSLSTKIEGFDKAMSFCKAF